MIFMNIECQCDFLRGKSHLFNFDVVMTYKRRGKKITCPGARDKLNFRQDKHTFSPNVRRASKKISASIFDNILRTSYLATGQVKI